MPKDKVSEWSSTPSNNTDIGGINIAEGCAPSGINNAIRELMAQVKDMQAGTDADSFVVGGNLTVGSTLTANSSVGTAGQVLVSRGAGLSPQWGAGFVSGMIVMWSGTIATIPTGWVLCDGTNSTPDLRNKFVIAADADSGGAAKTTITGTATQTGGTKDAIVVSHTHTGTTDSAGAHNHTYNQPVSVSTMAIGGANTLLTTSSANTSTAGTHTHPFTTDSAGSSGTNQNLPPYYALAFIMKS
jgi:hypothetical protein